MYSRGLNYDPWNDANSGIDISSSIKPLYSARLWLSLLQAAASPELMMSQNSPHHLETHFRHVTALAMLLQQCLSSSAGTLSLFRPCIRVVNLRRDGPSRRHTHASASRERLTLLRKPRPKSTPRVSSEGRRERFRQKHLALRKS